VNFSKPIMSPLSQHRYWCAWINSIGEGTNSKGYIANGEQIKTTLKLASSNNWINSPKYVSSIAFIKYFLIYFYHKIRLQFCFWK